MYLCIPHFGKQILRCAQTQKFVGAIIDRPFLLGYGFLAGSE